jgi:hypothetical protein
MALAIARVALDPEVRTSLLTRQAGRAPGSTMISQDED